MLSHVLPDGTEHPILFISRTLLSSEKSYAQIEKEALISSHIRVRKCHQYIYGRKFTLITNHKPLLAILGPKKGRQLHVCSGGLSAYSKLLSIAMQIVCPGYHKDCPLRLILSMR